MSHASRLDRASSIFFLFGFFVSKIQYIPNIVISSLLHLVSLVMYSTGYLLWFIGSYIHNDHRREQEHWYGFAQFREQHQISALIGLVACALSITAVFFPVVLLPASWLFFISNTVWSISEYHKLHNPPEDAAFSPGQQNAYLHYAAVLTVMSFIGALTTSLVFIVPQFVLPIIISSTLISLGLGALTTEYLLDFNFTNHPTAPMAESYAYLTQSLGEKVDPVDHPMPYHAKRITLDEAEENDPTLSASADFSFT